MGDTDSVLTEVLSMSISVIIPIWNGASVITRCLDALLPQLGVNDEVICVDNASLDNPAPLIEKYGSQVHLIPQPVNLGFAGGVNAGIEVARGKVLILLNQDCIVEPGWLDALVSGLFDHSIGIAGCKIRNSDGTLNHLGAQISHPLAFSVHLTEAEEHTHCVEYVTGAAFAIRRVVWETVGSFDEAFYPAYYEDADYCYRARRHGYEIVCVSAARATHLFSSQEWQADTLKYAANHHRSRYRFVCKHFTPEELKAFFNAELTALHSDRYFDHVVGRVLAARDILRGLPDVLTRRALDLGGTISTAYHRQLEIGFTSILREAFEVARGQVSLLSSTLPLPPSCNFPVDPENSLLIERERALWARLIGSPTIENHSIIDNLGRLLKRVARAISGEEARLLSELHTFQIERMARADQMNQRWIEQLAQTLQQQMEQRSKLLEILVDYDYR